jgi:UPF0716 protein FxsA
MPFLALLVLFVVVPIVELYVIIQVGQEIGALPTVALLVIDSVAGSLLMKSQGRAAWRRFQRATSEGRVPAREVLDGALIIFGGALLLTPGFVTDVVGLLFLLPPTRAVVRRLLVRRFAARMVVAGAGAFRGPRTPPRRPGADFDVEGKATEIDDPPRRLP